MSDILTKFEEEMAALRKEWTEFYGQFINKEETKDTLEVDNETTD